MALIPSLGLIFLSGLFLGKCAEKLGFPSLVGMILAGMLLAMGGESLLGEEITLISSELRKIALIMILLKAGLTLKWERLQTVGKPAFLMSFLPATMEILACILLAPKLFSLTLLESALLGSVLAAVSPAVVVPRMVSFMDRGIGEGKNMPELILAGASLDDVFVMVLFSAFLSLVEGGVFSASVLLEIPLSMVTGLGLGVFSGKLLSKLSFFQGCTLEQQIILLFGLSCGFFGLETLLPVSGLLAVMALGLSLEFQKKMLVADGFTSLWKAAEVLLFVLVGAEVDIRHGFTVGISGLLLLLCSLLFRCVGVYFATSSPQLGKNERRFAMISYLPKATVQAGIGGIPFAMGLPCGELILTMAVLAILCTAPVGAFLIDRYGETLLEMDK